MTNPYLRSAQQHPEIKAQAIAALESRQQQEDLVHSLDEPDLFIADEPTTPENEA